LPGLDGTGPRGMGPMTGGMRGWCTGFAPSPWNYRRRPFYGTAYPYGSPNWFPRMPYPNPAWGMPRMPPMQFGTSPWMNPSYGFSKEDEKEYLENEVKMLEEQLEQIRQRISEIDSEE